MKHARTHYAITAEERQEMITSLYTAANPSFPVGRTCVRAAVYLEQSVDFLTFLDEKIDHSRKTFGPDLTPKGVIKHIHKELVELESDEGALPEWVDIILLGIDGAWRTGATSKDILNAILTKFQVIKERDWPNWRELHPDEPVEHVRSEEEAAAHAELHNLGEPEPPAPASQKIEKHKIVSAWFKDDVSDFKILEVEPLKVLDMRSGAIHDTGLFVVENGQFIYTFKADLLPSKGDPIPAYLYGTATKLEVLEDTSGSPRRERDVATGAHYEGGRFLARGEENLDFIPEVGVDDSSVYINDLKKDQVITLSIEDQSETRKIVEVYPQHTKTRYGLKNPETGDVVFGAIGRVDSLLVSDTQGQIFLERFGNDQDVMVDIMAGDLIDAFFNAEPCTFKVLDDKNSPVYRVLNLSSNVSTVGTFFEVDDSAYTHFVETDEDGNNITGYVAVTHDVTE